MPARTINYNNRVTTLLYLYFAIKTSSGTQVKKLSIPYRCIGRTRSFLNIRKDHSKTMFNNFSSPSLTSRGFSVQVRLPTLLFIVFLNCNTIIHHKNRYVNCFKGKFLNFFDFIFPNKVRKRVSTKFAKSSVFSTFFSPQNTKKILAKCF